MTYLMKNMKTAIEKIKDAARELNSEMELTPPIRINGTEKQLLIDMRKAINLIESFDIFTLETEKIIDHFNCLFSGVDLYNTKKEEIKFWENYLKIKLRTYKGEEA